MMELALGQHRLDGLAVAGLAQRIDRLELDLDRESRPGMGRQIVIARSRRRLEMLAGKRQVEGERLARGVVLAGDDGLDALDAVIVVRLVFEPQHAAVGMLGRLGEDDGRRQVGHHRDGPGAERPAALHHRQLRAGGDGGAALEVAVVDAGEIGGLVVEQELRHRPPAMDLRQNAAPDRDRDRLWRRACGEELRCKPGVVGRRHPDIERDRNPRRARREKRGQAPPDPVGPVAAGVDRADEQRQAQRRAERVRIAAQQPRHGRTDAETAGFFRHAGAMDLPQRLRCRIVAAAEQPVLERGQRTMGEAARSFEPAPRRVAVGQPEDAEGVDCGGDEERREDG